MCFEKALFFEQIFKKYPFFRVFKHFLQIGSVSLSIRLPEK